MRNVKLLVGDVIFDDDGRRIKDVSYFERFVYKVVFFVLSDDVEN